MWNRSKDRAEALATEMNQLRSTFKNPDLNIVCSNSVEECVENADIIVTVTFAGTPFLFRSMVQDNVHINGKMNEYQTLHGNWNNNLLFSLNCFICLAVGAGINHFSELSKDLYTDPRTKIYVDSNSNAESELRGLYASIDGQVGDIINGQRKIPCNGITIFHSMGELTFFILSSWHKLINEENF